MPPRPVGGNEEHLLEGPIHSQQPLLQGAFHLLHIYGSLREGIAPQSAHRPFLKLTSDKCPEVPLEELLEIPFDLCSAHLPAGCPEICVFLQQDPADDLPGMIPFVNQMLQNPGIGML